jgi:hypothetical protein
MGEGWCELCLRFEIHLSPEFLYFLQSFIFEGRVPLGNRQSA